jgi:hypothetical protein
MDMNSHNEPLGELVDMKAKKQPKKQLLKMPIYSPLNLSISDSSSSFSKRKSAKNPNFRNLAILGCKAKFAVHQTDRLDPSFLRSFVSSCQP